MNDPKAKGKRLGRGEKFTKTKKYISGNNTGY